MRYVTGSYFIIMGSRFIDSDRLFSVGEYLSVQFDGGNPAAGPD
jgi:hypothetical protein